MLLIDLEKGAIITDQELKDDISNKFPYPTILSESNLTLHDLKSANSDYEEYNSDVPSGNVTWQYPKGGDLLGKGTGLHLTISLGVPPNFFQVPNLFGLSKKKAVEDLERAGFKLGKIFYRQNEDLIPYTVLNQSITAETVLEKPVSIDLTVSVLDMQDIFNQMISQ